MCRAPPSSRGWAFQLSPLCKGRRAKAAVCVCVRDPMGFLPISPLTEETVTSSGFFFLSMLPPAAPATAENKRRGDSKQNETPSPDTSGFRRDVKREPGFRYGDGCFSTAAYDSVVMGQKGFAARGVERCGRCAEGAAQSREVGWPGKVK